MTGSSTPPPIPCNRPAVTGREVEYMQQDTAWYERQLLDTQFVGEFKPTENLSLDVRASYAETKRDAPFELAFEYVRTNVDSDPYGKYFINRLNNGNNGDARVSFCFSASSARGSLRPNGLWPVV